MSAARLDDCRTLTRAPPRWRRASRITSGPVRRSRRCWTRLPPRCLKHWVGVSKRWLRRSLSRPFWVVASLPILPLNVRSYRQLRAPGYQRRPSRVKLQSRRRNAPFRSSTRDSRESSSSMETQPAPSSATCLGAASSCLRSMTGTESRCLSETREGRPLRSGHPYRTRPETDAYPSEGFVDTISAPGLESRRPPW